MKSAPVRNLAEMFLRQAAAGGDRPFLWTKRGQAYEPTSWRAAAAAVTAIARALQARGIGKGDRVALVAENRSEWAIADLAIVAAGAITVPAYTTYTEADHDHLLSDSGARAVIVSTPVLAERVLPAAARAGLGFAVAIEPEIAAPAGLALVQWQALIDEGVALPDTGAPACGRDDVACLIYTSGTGGLPKGVMLTHGNILHNCLGAEDLLQELGMGDDVFLSFLPLSHSYEHSAGQFFAISVGAQIYYAEGADTLAANMLEARPTIMTAVPRLFEVLHQRIVKGLRTQTPFRRRLFDRALALGLKRYHEGRLSIAERLQDMVLERLVRAKVRARFGGRLKALVSGGAPLNVEIGLFFHALGLTLVQGYGQTEAAPFVSCNRPQHVKMHTVGPPLKGVEARIAEDGEILVRGANVMAGYWNDSEATARAVQDGWLHTGDIGTLDGDGYLQITDRKKDIIVVSGGDNISPAKVEGLLCFEPEIAQAMVFGDKHPFLVALLVPEDVLANDAAGKEAAARDKALRATLSAALERVNARLSPTERIRGFAIADEPFSTANGMMTPTMKIRRHKIRERYRDRLEALYEQRGGKSGSTTDQKTGSA